MSERDLFFENISKSAPKTITTLKWLLDEYPTLVSIPNEFELHYQRAALIQKLADEKQKLNMTAFERGLKHIGLKCVQTTHKEYVKVWKLCNRGETLVSPTTKKINKIYVGKN